MIAVDDPISKGVRRSGFSLARASAGIDLTRERRRLSESTGQAVRRSRRAPSRSLKAGGFSIRASDDRSRGVARACPNRRGSLRRRRAEPAAIEQEIGGAPVRISSSAVADATAAVITAQPVSRG